MLSIRTDVLDYTGNAQHYDNNTDVAVYKKVDKVVRSFRAYAATKSINLHLEGTSFSRARGPDVLEIVPYVLLDNAIKYSPRGNDITISVFDAGKKTSFQVRSAGPLVNETERKKIFDKGVRGAEAKASGIKGSGAGLFIARQVVDQFKGTISVETSQSEFIIDDIKMTDIVFTVVLPTI
jgi:signal transduction histidine kinase